MTPVLKPATRAAAVAGSMVSPSVLFQTMSLLGAKLIETVSVVSRSSKETVPVSVSCWSEASMASVTSAEFVAETVGSSLVPSMVKLRVWVPVAPSESVAVMV